MSYKIIIDSCGEFLDEWKDDERFESVPLTLECRRGDGDR